ncbi:MAG: CBS domain-containing protein [Gemmatimonadota bacterium]
MTVAQDTTVRDILQKDVITIPPNAPVSDLIRRLESSGITGVPVVDEQEVLVGVVTSRDVVRLARDLGTIPEAARWGLGVGGPHPEVAFLDSPLEGEFFAYYVTPGGGFVDMRDRIREIPGDAFDGYSVEDIMTRDPVMIGPDATLAAAARLLRDKNVRRALVVRTGKLVGIVTATDILDAVAES